MTHDELLAEIEALDGTLIFSDGRPPIENVGVGDKINLALRAVVELHKPVEEDGKLWCRHEVCYNHIEFLERNDCYCSYPCPTIQAIEKELK